MGMNPFGLESMLRQMNEEVAKRAGISKHRHLHLLDAGCGVGEGLFQLAGGHPKCRFTGINISQKQIAFGNKKLEKSKLKKQVKLLNCDFQKTPFPAAHFDCAFAIESACYADGKDKSAFISEMARVLKNGGKLVVADGFLRHSKPLPKWLDRLHKKNLTLWSIEELADIQSFVEKLESNGFQRISVEEASWNILPSALHLPFTAIKIYWKRFFFKKKKKLTAAQKNYAKAIWLTLFLGMFRRHFGYFIITVELIRPGH